MRVLQAVFYPCSRSRPVPCFPIARIYFHAGQVSLEPAELSADSSVRLDLRASLEKLQYLVNLVGAPNAFDRLRNLRSEYWSFDVLSMGN